MNSEKGAAAPFLCFWRGIQSASISSERILQSHVEQMVIREHFRTGPSKFNAEYTVALCTIVDIGRRHKVQPHCRKDDYRKMSPTLRVAQALENDDRRMPKCLPLIDVRYLFEIEVLFFAIVRCLSESEGTSMGSKVHVKRSVMLQSKHLFGFLPN